MKKALIAAVAALSATAWTTDAAHAQRYGDRQGAHARGEEGGRPGREGRDDGGGREWRPDTPTPPPPTPQLEGGDTGRGGSWNTGDQGERRRDWNTGDQGERRRDWNTGDQGERRRDWNTGDQGERRRDWNTGDQGERRRDWDQNGRRRGGNDDDHDGRGRNWNDGDGRNWDGDRDRGNWDGRHRRRDLSDHDWGHDQHRDRDRYRRWSHNHSDWNRPRYNDWRRVRHGYYFDRAYALIVSGFFSHNYYWWGYDGWRRPYRPWRVGDYLPYDIWWEPVPYDLYYRLPPAPYGCRYIMVDRDILLIVVSNGLILDALFYY